MSKVGIPERIGRYRVIDRLGAGGMAEVFLATQDGPGDFSKTVVVKRSFPHLVENQAYVDMFMREATIAARLNHPNIVQIYDFGEDSGLYFIAMEFVDGLTLHRLAKRAWRRGRSLPMEVIVRAAVDAALGLHHAHSGGLGGAMHGLVHRDISPDNLMINKDGVTKVLDFGIAKASDNKSVTRSGEIKGKIPFMSPEQIQGQPLDGRSDLYALGVCLYWLLTGERPFKGESDFVIMQSVLQQQVPPPSALNPKVPPALDQIVQRLMAKDREARFADGATLALALRQLIDVDHQQCAPLVAELSVASSDDGGDIPTVSSNFLPATPVSTKLAESGMLPVAHERSRKPIAALVVGAFVAMFVLAGALAFVFSTDANDDVATIEAPTITAPTLKPNAKPDAEPVVEKAKPQDAGPKVVVAEVTQTEKAKRRRLRRRRKKEPEEKPAPEPVVETERVVLKGPSTLRFVIDGARMGPGKADVKKGTTSLRVVDSATGGQHTVPITGGVCDWNALPSGTVDVRVYPWAEVQLGKRRLGKTPLGVKKFKVGTYTFALTRGDLVKRETVTVRAGQKSVLKARFE